MPKSMPSRTTTPPRQVAEVIEIRGASQNNLKGVDLDVPLRSLVVVTGPSGSGKSSLAFQTIYAEGQRRYVETFSPYVRQFFDRMDKPKVDQIRGIPPAIAIEQSNQVKTTRSTVGTITEINDYLKLLFPRLAEGYCPECGGSVKPDSPTRIQEAALEAFGEKPVLVLFGVEVPQETSAAEFFPFLQSQGFVRVRLFGEIYRTEEPGAYARRLPQKVDVVQDRVAAARKSRFLEAVETALHLGKGRMRIVEPESGREMSFSNSWHCAACDISIREPVPGLFSFNNPLGACPVCKGFGRVIGIDLDRALPNRTLSIREGVVKAFQGEKYQECQVDLERYGKRRGLDLDVPFEDLPEKDRKWVLFGDRGGVMADEPVEGEWYGVKGFFNWLERNTYKMHIRVFLSRYRSYTECPACRGMRLQPEALQFRIGEFRLPDLWRVPIGELEGFVAGLRAPAGDSTAELLLEQIGSRLGYLNQVGLSYLDLDRPTRSLSGGEVQRVNLTTCLGASLTNTLFVLDEPSIGLHPRDVGRLIEVLHGLREKGNTLVVVEHEEAVIRAADHLIDVGPGRGEQGGHIVYQGPVAGLAKRGSAAESLTRDYLTGRKTIPIPAKRRKWKRSLQVIGAREHNLQKLDVQIPLGVFTCVTGVSGSGKSTLVHDVLYRNLLRMRGESSESEAGQVREIRGAEAVGEVVMVDQSPLSRTPRSTPAVFCGAFEGIRKLFAETPDAQSRGLTNGYFSFNSGGGRCERCWGTGYEKVEMQFLSDIYIPCSECEGKRYTPETLEVKLAGCSIHEVLEMTVSQAMEFFAQFETQKAGRDVVASLSALEEVGLGYLRLGQPLNALSGGESQRLKLVAHLLEKKPARGGAGAASLLILDEPTTGLHFDDIAILLGVFHRLVEEGNTLLVIEHNLDVIRSADWIIDLGPEAGKDGGRLVAEGTPEEIAAHPTSHTGAALRSPLLRRPDGLSLGRVQDRSPAFVARENVIAVAGARENNLKNISLRIPRDQMVTVTGLSGSGKSTLAFDILFAEGQRRFLDSMSAYARQFVEQMEKPHVDHIDGLPPTVAIEQRISRGGGKSTVATVTEVYHFLRLLFAKVGIQHSPATGKPVIPQSVTSIVTQVRAMAKSGPVTVLAPLVKARKGFHTEVAEWARRQGFAKLLVDNQFRDTEGFEKLERFKEHTIEVVVGEIHSGTKPPEARETIELGLKIGKQAIRVLDSHRSFCVFSTRLFCPDSGRSFEDLDPRLFSYNSPHGWCPACRGYGEVLRKPQWARERDEESAVEAELREERERFSMEAEEFETCAACGGARLNEVALAVRVQGRSIAEVARLSVSRARLEMESFRFRGKESAIARDILPEISQRLRFLEEVGLGYLQLDRSVKTLSGGEAQRIRLAAQLGSNLRGVLYVLDEPTIGLHPRDNAKLLDTLAALRNKGNSLLVVEHDEETVRRSDYVIDLGPGAGRFGGEITACGTIDEIMENEHSVTGRQLRSPMVHPVRGSRRALPAKNSQEGWLRIEGACANNLRNISVRIPLGRLSVLCGISGSGKSSLMRGVIQPAVQAQLSRKERPEKAWQTVRGAERIGAVYEVDQSPIGKTSRSCPATYTKVFDDIRKVFAQLPESRAHGFSASRFSFNTEGGRCEACKGNGRLKLEMNFLPTSWIPCEDCKGLRFNAATLEVLYRGKSIGEVMQMSVDEAVDFFEASPRIARSLRLLKDTGLGYLQLGQPSPTLSGGEAQRLKLVTELTRGVQRAENEELRRNRQVESFLYLIEEPSIGLHLADVERLLDVLHRLVDRGATVLVIEHNLDIIAEADYLLEMGPEAGEQGGTVVFAGAPEAIVGCGESRTAPFLRELLARGAKPSQA